MPRPAQIAAAIDAGIGSSSMLERVAMQLARGLYPELVHTLAPQGSNLAGKPVPGWPDAYMTCADGAVIAIEATSESRAHTAHWPCDLADAKSTLLPAERGGLIWVAWNNPPAGRAGSARVTEQNMIAEAVALGFPAEHIHIFFKNKVCEALRSPVHADFWVNELGLNVTSDPFASLRPIPTRTADRTTLTIFPTREDYEADRVHTPAILGDVEATLLRECSALVVARGASGKTTLARLLAFRETFAAKPAYYLDLMNSEIERTLAADAVETIAATSAPGILYVVDNAHLNLSAAVEIEAGWRMYGKTSYLLVLARDVRGLRLSWDDSVGLEALNAQRLDLIVRPSDLFGIYRRLAHGVAPDKDPTAVSDVLLTEWEKAFGGDLLMFGAAVVGCLRNQRDIATLCPEDAYDYVRKEYLDAAGDEKSALLDLAAVSEIEGHAPTDAFAPKAFKASMARGLVWVEARGRADRYKAYRLPHPGLGSMLRGAEQLVETSRQSRRRVLAAHPFAATAIANILRRNGDQTEAKDLLTAVWAGDGWPLSKIDLGWWTRVLRPARLANAVGDDEIAGRAMAWLRIPGVDVALKRQALDVNLATLTPFFGIMSRLVPDIACAVWSGLTEDRDALIKKTVDMPWRDLCPFMDATKDRVPDITDDIWEAVASTSVGDLVTKAQSEPLEHLGYFIQRARTARPAVAQAIVDGLIADPQAGDWTRRWIAEGGEKIVALCRIDPAFAAVLTAVDGEAWKAAWQDVNHGQPTWFPEFARLCRAVDRPDLIGVTAAAIIRTTKLDDFPMPGSTLPQVAFILTSPHDCAPYQVAAFLAERLPPDWLTRQYQSRRASTGALGSALSTLALDERTWLGQMCVVPSLFERLDAAWSSESAIASQVAGTLQLLCGTALLDDRLAPIPPMEPSLLLSAIAHWRPAPSLDRLQSIQAKLWGGLREWRRLSRQDLAVEGADGAVMLAQFRAADPQGRPRMRAFNGVMIDWLQRCEAAGWRLVAEDTSLKAALENQLARTV